MLSSHNLSKENYLFQPGAKHALFFKANSEYYFQDLNLEKLFETTTCFCPHHFLSQNSLLDFTVKLQKHIIFYYNGHPRAVRSAIVMLRIKTLKYVKSSLKCSLGINRILDQSC